MMICAMSWGLDELDHDLSHNCTRLLVPVPVMDGSSWLMICPITLPPYHFARIGLPTPLSAMGWLRRVSQFMIYLSYLWLGEVNFTYPVVGDGRVETDELARNRSIL